MRKSAGIPFFLFLWRSYAYWYNAHRKSLSADLAGAKPGLRQRGMNQTKLNVKNPLRG